jgi:hypothetical protein
LITAEDRAEGEQFKLASRDEQRAVIALHRSVADNPKVPAPERTVTASEPICIFGKRRFSPDIALRNRWQKPVHIFLLFDCIRLRSPQQ